MRLVGEVREAVLAAVRHALEHAVEHAAAREGLGLLAVDLDDLELILRFPHRVCR